MSETPHLPSDLKRPLTTAERRQQVIEAARQALEQRKGQAPQAHPRRDFDRHRCIWEERYGLACRCD